MWLLSCSPFFYIYFSALIFLLESILHFFHCCLRRPLASVALASRWLTPSDVGKVAGWQISFSVELIITFIHPLHLNGGIRCAENEIVPSSPISVIPQPPILDYMPSTDPAPSAVFCFVLFYARTLLFNHFILIDLYLFQSDNADKIVHIFPYTLGLQISCIFLKQWLEHVDNHESINC